MPAYIGQLEKSINCSFLTQLSPQELNESSAIIPLDNVSSMFLGF